MTLTEPTPQATAAVAASAAPTLTQDETIASLGTYGYRVGRLRRGRCLGEALLRCRGRRHLGEEERPNGCSSSA